MTPASGTDASAEGLTSEQRLAAATRLRNLYIEAGPGTGKTTVSAQRFGVQRFDPARRYDSRAVVAVSFTRAATRTLVRRAMRFWGRAVVQWPHRVVTLDTVIVDLVHDLLHEGLLKWPNGHTVLDVHDSWTSLASTTWNRTTYTINVQGDQIIITRGWRSSSQSSVPATVTLPLLKKGICTHDDIRAALEQALQDPAILAFVENRFRASMRALIVDEVFDANDLDIAVIETAITAGISVTLVGDPWQALYMFRGARPENVPVLIARAGVTKLSLTQSFRWLDPRQRDLAEKLRSAQPVTLESESVSDGFDKFDVALALTWKPLWDLGSGVLPLAFTKAFGGSTEEAAATLLLNHVTRNVLGLDASYLADALTALAISDRDVPRQLEHDFQIITQILCVPGNDILKTVYNMLTEIIGRVSPRLLRPSHHSYTSRLALIRIRLLHKGRPAPGLTTHQAKGREWDVVGVHLSDTERKALAGGLSMHEDTHRKLYVACTRARRRTIELV